MPVSMAALGDSITQAYGACAPWRDCPEISWSTGSEPGIASHRQRLGEELGTHVTAHNFAESGATVAGLEAQARHAVAAQVDYVTVLIGGNDACAATEDAMTSVDAFRTRFGAAMSVLTDGLPATKVLVVSVPDLRRLVEVGRADPRVRATWSQIGVCRGMLADPASDDAADRARRQRVGQRVVDYNEVMAAECRRHPGCRWDEGALFAHRFPLEAVSQHDYWHPSPLGQRLLSEIAWEASSWP